jgi:hypothetical protein
VGNLNNDYDFVKVNLKKDVAEQIDKICKDAKKYGIFISKSDLLRVMVFDGNVIELSIKKIVYNKNQINSGL